jgi:hypothetical protein
LIIAFKCAFCGYCTTISQSARQVLLKTKPFRDIIKKWFAASGFKNKFIGRQKPNQYDFDRLLQA